MRPGPKPRLDETRYIPRTEEQEHQLFSALVDAGTGPHQALNIVHTLAVLEDLPRPLSNKVTSNLVLYRKRLATIGPPPWERETAPRGPRLRLSALVGATPTGAIGGYVTLSERRVGVVQLAAA